MAITVIFYKTNSDPRALEKSLTEIGTLSCELLDRTSIDKPSMLVSLADTYKGANYMYIQDFNRYYYITATIENGSMCRLDGKSDVLMSFKTGIKNTKILLNRTSQNNKSNLYYADDKIRKYAYERTQCKLFPNSPFSNDGYCVLMTAGGAAAT